MFRGNIMRGISAAFRKKSYARWGISDGISLNISHLYISHLGKMILKSMETQGPPGPVLPPPTSIRCRRRREERSKIPAIRAAKGRGSEADSSEEEGAVAISWEDGVARRARPSSDEVRRLRWRLLPAPLMPEVWTTGGPPAEQAVETLTMWMSLGAMVVGGESDAEACAQAAATAAAKEDSKGPILLAMAAHSSAVR